MTSFAPQSSWRIAYDALGAGRPSLVFIHGASCDRAVWKDVVNGLRGHCQTIALDRLGYGESDQPAVPYRMTTFAESVLAVMDHEDVPRAVLVGHSNGVAVARQVYRVAPDRVAGLVLLDGPLEQGLSAGHVEWMRSKLREPGYETMLQGMVAQMPMNQLSPQQAEVFQRAALAVPQHVMLGELEAITDESVWTADPVNVPLLVIRAAGPNVAATERAFVLGLNGEAVYEVWDDVSHFLIMEAAARVSARIQEFAQSVDDA